MSGATSLRDLLSPNRITPGSVVGVLRDALGAPLRRLAFWAAIVLPLAYLPLLVGGLRGEETPLFAALIAANAAALLIGHGYGD